MIEALSNSASVAALTAATSGEKLASEWLAEYLRDDFKKRKNVTAERDVAPYVIFMIKLLGDRPMTAYTSEDLERLNEALCEVPNHGNVPVQHRKSLWERYQYAKTHGWQGLQWPSGRRTRLRLRETHRRGGVPLHVCNHLRARLCVHRLDRMRGSQQCTCWRPSPRSARWPRVRETSENVSNVETMPSPHHSKRDALRLSGPTTSFFLSLYG